jgi:tetratricopeptide (TPR) repeat protein
MLISVTVADGRVLLMDQERPNAKPVEASADLGHVFNLDEILRIPAALWQPRGAAISEFEHRPEWAQVLKQALSDAQARPRPLSVPRRIFISYRWGTPDSDAWVERLNRELELRGNQIVFDRKVERELRPPSVPELVARIAGCHVFLAILDAGYLERVATDNANRDEGWVTDEFHTALAFASQGTVVLLGILRDGDELPPGFRPFESGVPGNTFDVREPDALTETLDRYFIQFGSAPTADVAAAVAVTLHESRRAFEAGDHEAALELADGACRLIPDMADGFAQRARVGYRAGKPVEAFRDAQQALRIDPTLDEMLIFASASACDLGNWREAARFGRMALERNRGHANAHYLVGKALNELGEVDAALAHFGIARASRLSLRDLYNSAGWAARRAGHPHTALTWYIEGFELSPFDEVLLTNATAAAIESGNATQAMEMLQLLAKHHPKSQAIPTLVNILARFCREDGPPPVLSRLVEKKIEFATASCEKCQASVALTHESRMLCQGCGANVGGLLEACSCCGDAGKAPVELECICPYCHRGGLRYTKLDGLQ